MYKVFIYVEPENIELEGSSVLINKILYYDIISRKDAWHGIGVHKSCPVTILYSFK